MFGRDVFSAKKSRRVQEAKNLGYSYPGSPSVAPPTE
jgi:hypothetical protein